MSRQETGGHIEKQSSLQQEICKKNKGIYLSLMELYGPQGWWPLLELEGSISKNPTKTGSVRGYHPGDYTYPRTKAQQFEICVGAILTQNTAWPNVEKALLAMRRQKLLSPAAIIRAEQTKLGGAIRPAGYFNQKAKKLKIFAKFYSTTLKNGKRVPARDELLSLWGIGPETADSMLLYAFKQPSFVVDTYTKKIFLNLGLIGKSWSYDQIKALFVDAVPKNLEIYQEYHALIVEHAKRHYGRRADPKKCPLFKEYVI
jgi:endonuclease-3 related protein